MKILIVVCRQSTMRSYHLPLGIGYVSACLKRAGHAVEILNPNHSCDPLDALVAAAVAKHQPEMVALGGMAFHLREIKDVAKLVRQLLPSATIVVGGPLVSTQPEVVLSAIPEMDIGVIGEGEHTSVELAAALEAKTSLAEVRGLAYRDSTQPGQVVKTQPRPIEENLDALPWVDYEGLGLDVWSKLHKPGECAPALILDENTRVMPVMTSRGCPYACTFCCHEAAGRRYRLRSLDSVFGEIEEARARWGINAIFVYDDLFCLQRERLEEFCRRIEPMGMRWECSMTVGQINPDMLKMMKKSGCCCISIGVESMSPTVLQSMKKKATREQLEIALAQIYEAEIGLWSNLIFGDPKESLETVTESLEWYSNHAQYNFRFANIGYHPGSRIYDEARASGRIGDPATYLLSNRCEINGTAMSQQDFVTSRVLANRAQLSFGHAGKLLDITADPTKGVVACCLCPYCGAEGRLYPLPQMPGSLCSINCPKCNRAYRVPAVVHLKESAEGAKALEALQLLECSGAPVPELEAACNRLLTLSPWNGYAWNLLVSIADHCGNSPLAATFLENAIVVDPYNPSLFEQMATRLALLGLPSAREKYARKARHLRSLGILLSGRLEVEFPPAERKYLLEQQVFELNLGLFVASFAYPCPKESLKAAS
jgi:radical SAM superfamily enzyme YgiQ (UPF0313 family)